MRQMVADKEWRKAERPLFDGNYDDQPSFRMIKQDQFRRSWVTTGLSIYGRQDYEIDVYSRRGA